MIIRIGVNRQRIRQKKRPAVAGRASSRFFRLQVLLLPFAFGLSHHVVLDGERHFRSFLVLLQRIDEQNFVFTCTMASPDNPRVVRRFEADADNPLEAVQQVLEQIDEWRGRGGVDSQTALLPSASAMSGLPSPSRSAATIDRGPDGSL